MNEWLAHLCNPQQKSQQLQDLKGAMLPSIKSLNFKKNSEHLSNQAQKALLYLI